MTPITPSRCVRCQGFGIGRGSRSGLGHPRPVCGAAAGCACVIAAAGHVQVHGPRQCPALNGVPRDCSCGFAVVYSLTTTLCIADARFVLPFPMVARDPGGAGCGPRRQCGHHSDSEDGERTSIPAALCAGGTGCIQWHLTVPKQPGACVVRSACDVRVPSLLTAKPMMA